MRAASVAAALLGLAVLMGEPGLDGWSAQGAPISPPSTITVRPLAGGEVLPRLPSEYANVRNGSGKRSRVRSAQAALGGAVSPPPLVTRSLPPTLCPLQLARRMHRRECRC